ncbi:MAG: type I secretion system permease/ATPase, partial [Alphaproteobacteria bacterium]|nr:type I secretion system permease/ATPase [Alphaproteobacteria bacterium]
MRTHASPLALAVARCRPALAIATGFALVINVLMLVVPIYMMQVYDRVLSSGSGSTLIFLTVIAAGLLLTMGVLDAARSGILSRAGIWLEGHLSPLAFERAADAAIDGKPYRTEALRDLGTLRGFLGGPAMTALMDMPWMPLYLAFAFALHPWLGWIATGLAALLLLIALANDRATSKALGRSAEISRAAVRGAETALRNAEAAEAMGITSTLTAGWRGELASILSAQRSAGDLGAGLGALSKTVRLLGQIAILGAGAWLAVKQEITPGALIAASVVTARALAPVEQAIAGWRQARAALAAFRKLEVFLAAPARRPRAMSLPAPRGPLTVEGAGYTL